MKYIKLKSLIKEIFSDTDNVDVSKHFITRTMDGFTKSYIESALWSSMDNLTPSGGEPLDKKYTIDDIENETLQKMERDCKDFQSKYENLYDSGGWSDEQAAHDFWLTRNRHGTGFADRGYDYDQEEIGQQLVNAAKSYGEFNLFLGDGPYDGMIVGG